MVVESVQVVDQEIGDGNVPAVGWLGAEGAVSVCVTHAAGGVGVMAQSHTAV